MCGPFLRKSKVKLSGTIVVDNSESELTSDMNNIGGMIVKTVYRNFVSGDRDFRHVKGFLKHTLNDDGTRTIVLYIYHL